MKKTKKVKAVKDQLFDLIGLTENQVQTIANALDLYSRVGSCQFEAIAWMASFEGILPNGSRAVDHDEVRMLCDKLKACYGFVPNSSYGIFHRSVKDNFKSSYDLYKIIMHRLKRKRDPDDKMWSVHSAYPLFSSRDRIRPDLMDHMLKLDPLPAGAYPHLGRKSTVKKGKKSS